MGQEPGRRGEPLSPVECEGCEGEDASRSEVDVDEFEEEEKEEDVAGGLCGGKEVDRRRVRRM